MADCVLISCFGVNDARMNAIAAYMEEKGFRVIRITSDFNHLTKRVVSDDDRVECTQYVHVPMYRKNYSFMRIYSHIEFALRSHKRLMALKPELVVARFPPNSVVKYIGKYKQSSNPIVIYDCYDLWPESFTGRFPKALQFIWSRMRDKWLGGADLVLCASDSKVSYLKSKHPSALIKRWLPLSDYDACPSSGLFPESGRISICYLGNINHIFDIDLALAFFKRLAPVREIELHIIGEGERLDSFCDKLSRCKVDVICHGTVFDASEKELIYARCQLGLNLPRPSTNITLSLKSIEYIKAGLPMLNSAPEDTWDYVNSYEIGMNFNYKTLESAIDSILELDNEKLRQMQTNCKKCYQELFENQNMEQIFDTVIDNL